MVKLIWTELALEDLKEIHEYIARDSKIYAKRQVAKIIKKAEKIYQQPLSGRVVPEFSNERIREIFEGNYRIICKIDYEAIIIMRIDHSARLLKAIK
ncbi:type II toxin-antitoxin system RelE/ParE family toxin [Algoriphagus sp. C2-6-M1]|uniref:type II toxin-antitoxin system RelE/ParE family toxin n=1 Tax=Algoriphagus persicinus TaxID=3108754 RepID=UPI002B370D48|nr:type II toxin-antitoxin system RelE/ParE family toxin [Algoriphagus sp. C2-6-M1]MEB2779520.1 type II toxin-antitoxin system RelE/ParE family toxin [Algoriphagus sp. C2-6-M1]